MKSKPRNTPLKKFIALVNQGDMESLTAAEELLIYGRQRTKLEGHFDQYYTFGLFAGFDHRPSNMKTRKKKSDPHTISVDELREIFAEQRENIINIFLDAVNRYDANKILEIAETVTFLRDHPPLSSRDPERRWLLFLKARLLQRRQTMATKEVAEYLESYLKRPVRDLSNLAKKCRQIGFPLTETRQSKGGKK